MKTLGASVAYTAPGECHLSAPVASSLLQHDGFFHAGVTIALADTAAGCAALTLFDEGSGVLSTELKVNLLRPAHATPGAVLMARASVIKPGRTLTVCRSDAYVQIDDAETHVATLLLTMISPSIV